MPLLRSLRLLDDLFPRKAALNMALDEVLLDGFLEVPILRIYRWRRPAVSFGYFEKWASIEAGWPNREPVRRWTGGGIVPHGEDFTYSLLAGVEEPISQMSLTESYRSIHSAVADALTKAGVDCAVVDESSNALSRACFENPVQFDIIRGTRKIAGAAQRRTARGLLHQGSIHVGDLPEGFANVLAEAFSGSVSRIPLDEAILRQAQELAAVKYGTEEWLRRV